MQKIISLLEHITFYYFLISSTYILVFAISGHFYKKRSLKIKVKRNKYAILIPAYKEDSVIVEVAKASLNQSYNSSNYDVIIIADSLLLETINKLKKLPIKIVNVSFDKSTKAKALNQALKELDNNYEYVVVLDADNIMMEDFLLKINSSFDTGFKVVQGHRTAKNKNTPYAILDAASEEINNHIFRKGHRPLGLSSGLIGSGMAFEFKLFQSIMKKIDVVGGFDKEIEFQLAAKKIPIEYLQDAIVLDEKIQQPDMFSKQRKRWLSTQFVFLQKYFYQGIKELFVNYNINFFDKIFQLLIPPRILLFGFTLLITIFYYFIDIFWNLNTSVSFNYWLMNLSFVVIAFLLALPISFYNKKTLIALVFIPSAFIRMFHLLFKLKGADKNFIHTTHNSIQ